MGISTWKGLPPECLRESGRHEGETAVTRRKEPRRPRSKRTWELNPVQRTCSTPRGSKGHAPSRKRKVPREELRVRSHKDARRSPRIVVLVSGEGAQLDEIFSYIDHGLTDVQIVAVIGDDPGARGIRSASERGIRTLIVEPTDSGDVKAFSSKLKHTLDRLNPDVVVLDGFTSSVGLKDRKNRRVTDRAEVLLEIAATD